MALPSTQQYNINLTIDRQLNRIIVLEMKLIFFSLACTICLYFNIVNFCNFIPGFIVLLVFFSGSPCWPVHRISKSTRKLTERDQKSNALSADIFRLKREIAGNTFTTENTTGALHFILSIPLMTEGRQCMHPRSMRWLQGKGACVKTHCNFTSLNQLLGLSLYLLRGRLDQTCSQFGFSAVTAKRFISNASLYKYDIAPLICKKNTNLCSAQAQTHFF